MSSYAISSNDIARVKKRLRKRRLVGAEFRDDGDAACLRNHQCDRARAGRADAVELAMTDRRAARDRRPHAVRFGFDSMLPDAFAESDRLLDADDVERARRAEIELDARAARAFARRPEGVDLAVHRHRRL